MMEYIAGILGIKTHTEPWSGLSKLPYYLIDRYAFSKVILDGISCLFIKPTGSLDTLTAVRKHITKINEIERLPIVLELDGITSGRRKSLIGGRIPFVAPGYQIYLPFMGIILTERFLADNRPCETLMPSSQLLFFYYLHRKGSELHTNGMDEKLRMSSMQISRSIRQLKTLGLVAVRKDGTRIVLCENENCRELFERSKPYLLNPVRKKLYVNEIPLEYQLAGLSALSELSILGTPLIKTFAVSDMAGLTGTDVLLDNETQFEVEVWKYNPALLSKRPCIVDPLSLSVSLRMLDDERVEQAVQEMLAAFWEDKEWSGD